MRSIILLISYMTILSNCYCQKSELEKFCEFFSNFHSDSVYQMDHILFPISGINTDSMNFDDTIYYWEKEHWELHVNKDIDTSLFEWKLTLGISVAEELIISKTPGIIISRKFIKKEDEWFLYEYKDINL